MFYTYLWLREDGTPYYVGKGRGRRAYERFQHKQNPPPINRMVFYIAKDEADALETEIALIWYYGRKDLGNGCLRNLTSGGDGLKNPSQETRQKMAAAKVGKRGNNTGHAHSQATRLGISMKKKGCIGVNAGRVFSAEVRLKMSIAAKNRCNKA